ncbi:glycosyltransferase family 4 protein [Mycolicibacterium boenickei]|uniref:Glycosyl transferase n=1 Tax=Mycolicibacterium boenickei TaxID=146017 RepID=A0AAX2ZXJ6_9MYCO|nr:glycosyltransferase family 1 protein [Mycolicibacterium boenickei]PEG56734.1 glycosyltransferase family 1 protein [Mycolicibacterium boenickei]UNB99455.1 glycosyltransferase family 4 protein [Mycolicibacterium boenickei]BBX89096.1 glycosyl transferase [Mycolicibacterium boenickei]
MAEHIDLLLDARHINQSGIGTYIRTELPTVEKTLAQQGLSFGVLVDEGKAPPLDDSTTVAFARPSNAGMYSTSEQQVWRHALKRLRPRALWLPHYPFPLSILGPGNKHTKLFVTIHDILHLQPQSVSGKGFAYRAYARAMITMDARRCSKIFTPSRATADALAAVSPKAQTVVTPIPVGEAWLTPADTAFTPIDGRYVLFVGNAKWHKNLPVLFEAFREIASEIPQKLVIAGAGESVRNFDDRLAGYATELADRVQMIGRLDFETLRAMVAGADLLVMPSLYEGAGLPPLEAMASHTAVLASSIPSLRETCGNGAEYFDPYDYRTLAELLRTFCRDDTARSGLVDRGWAHVNSRQSQIKSTTAADTICAELLGAGR